MNNSVIDNAKPLEKCLQIHLIMDLSSVSQSYFHMYSQYIMF